MGWLAPMNAGAAGKKIRDEDPSGSLWQVAHLLICPLAQRIAGVLWKVFSPRDAEASYVRSRFWLGFGE